jgi:hypothetical protein
MTTLGKRTRTPSPACPEDFSSTTKALSKRTKLRLRLLLPATVPDPEQAPPSPLPLHHFLIRGIVPFLPTTPESCFNWRSTINIDITTRHFHSKTLRFALGSLVKSGRRYTGTTPGLTIKRAGERAIRYEYWPVFDEHVDENEWTPRWPRGEMVLGKPLERKMVQELSEYFYRPAHIPETVDFC